MPGQAAKASKADAAAVDGNGHVNGNGWAGRFLKGVAVSVWQNSGDPDSNWTRFAKSRWPFSWFGVSTIRGKYNIDTCSDFWNKCVVVAGRGLGAPTLP